MTKTINKKFITLAVALVAILSLALVGCSSQKTENTGKNDFAAEFANTEHIKLSMGAATYAANSSSVSKTLTATVLPATATNKSVDWSVEWADPENTSNVTEYVTVTPETSGSTTATVTCYKAFTGNVIVTVTTRESGYSATCIVSFIGLPTDITLSGSVTPSGGFYKVGIGQTYTFPSM